MAEFHRTNRTNIKKFLSWLILGCLTSVVFAGLIPAPPPNKEESVEIRNFLRQVYDNWNTLEVITSSPDGSRRAQKGYMLVLISGSTFQLWINVDGATNWASVNLTD